MERTRMFSTERALDWPLIYRLGALCAVAALALTLFDIVLSMLPGWEIATTPTTPALWLEQAAARPWLAVRNLDLLNVAVSFVSLPMYLALHGVQRRSAPALSLLALATVVLGTAVFLASNVALPMLGLAREYADATVAARSALEPAAAALLARGAHGSLGAFPGFFVSAIGTLLMAVAMLLGGVFSRRTAWIGTIGSVAITTYVLLVTFTPVPETAILALAAPGGLLLLAWNGLVARDLLRISRRGEMAPSTERTAA